MGLNCGSIVRALKGAFKHQNDKAWTWPAVSVSCKVICDVQPVACVMFCDQSNTSRLCLKADNFLALIPVFLI